MAFFDEPEQKGYIKLFRRLLDHPVWKAAKPAWRCAMIGILVSANHDNGQWFDGHEWVSVQRGEWIGSLANMASRCGISVQEFRSAILFLKKLEILTSESTSRWTRLSITNYDKWQSNRAPANKPNPEPLTSPQQAVQQASNKPLTSALTTNKKEERIENQITPNTRGVLDDFPLFRDVCLTGGLSLTQEDMDQAKLQWDRLDFSQRLAAVKGVRERIECLEFSDPAYVPLPQNYLKQRIWNRPLRDKRDKSSANPSKKSDGYYYGLGPDGL